MQFGSPLQWKCLCVMPYIYVFANKIKSMNEFLKSQANSACLPMSIIRNVIREHLSVTSSIANSISSCTGYRIDKSAVKFSKDIFVRLKQKSFKKKFFFFLGVFLQLFAASCTSLEFNDGAQRVIETVCWIFRLSFPEQQNERETAKLETQQH